MGSHNGRLHADSQHDTRLFFRLAVPDEVNENRFLPPRRRENGTGRGRRSSEMQGCDLLLHVKSEKSTSEDKRLKGGRISISSLSTQSLRFFSKVEQHFHTKGVQMLKKTKHNNQRFITHLKPPMNHCFHWQRTPSIRRRFRCSYVRRGPSHYCSVAV